MMMIEKINLGPRQFVGIEKLEGEYDLKDGKASLQVIVRLLREPAVGLPASRSRHLVTSA